MESVHEIVRRAEDNYLKGTTKLGEHVNWSMHDTIERIDAYLNSKHISGDTDSLGREKPFFNIVTAAVNIWYRATDIDRKDIRFIPTKASGVVLAFVANVLLQNWMTKNRFGQFLNSWGRELARYGSAIPKFVEKAGQLVPSVVPWNRYIADPVDFEALPRIEKLYYTSAQLRRIQEYDQEQVDKLISAATTRKTLDKEDKDNMSDFIEVYEVHGELDSRYLSNDPDLTMEDKDITYSQQMHVISYIEAKDGKFNDFTLYKGRERVNPLIITHLIEEDGRTISIGAVEYLFDSQWMQNHTVKNMKDTLDLASRLIFQTADTRYAGRNVLSAIETGDIFVHAPNMPLTRVANDKPDVTALMNYSQMWRNLANELVSTPDAIKGNTLPSGTPYSLGAYLGAQANSLFEIMTENKGLAIEDMMRTYVIPHLRKQLKNKKELVAVLDSAGIEEIDAMYVPKAAVRRFNKRAIDEILNGGIPSPFIPQQEEQTMRQELGMLGNKRFFSPDELGKKQWDEIFSDFEWDNIRVEVTNEQTDKQAVLQTLSAVLQTIASNPLILQDPNAKMVFSAILSETGKISPLQISNATSSAPVAPVGDAEGINNVIPEQ